MQENIVIEDLMPRGGTTLGPGGMTFDTSNAMIPGPLYGPGGVRKPY